MSDELSKDLASLRINRDAPTRREPSVGKKLIVPVLSTVVVLCLLIFVVVPAVQGKLFKTKVDVAEIIVVSPAQAQVQLTSTGYVVPQRISQVAAKVGGRVAEVKIKQGQTVATGDVLLILEKLDQEQDLLAARNRVLVSRANAETARANLAELEQQLTREKKLVASGVSPSAAAEDLEKRVASLRAQAKAAEVTIRTSSAEAESISLMVQNYTLVTPMAGTVLNKPPEVGEMVGPVMGGIASSAGGVEIADLTSLAVETDVPEARLRLIKLGGPAEIVLDAYPDRRFRGEAYEIVPKVNRAKATVMVKVRFTDDTKDVLPEMAARVSFLSQGIDDEAIKKPPILVVPAGALVERQGRKIIFTLDAGRVRMTPVEVGAEAAGGFELRKGPPAGTRVVKDPPEDLADGQEVKEKTDT